MPAPTSTRPEERDFVVDSGASMHMLSEKDLSSAELKTLRRSRIPTTVVTANGEVQTTRRHRHTFTPAVLSLGKLFEDQRYSYEWVSGQKPRLTKEGKTIICTTNNFVPLVVPNGRSTSKTKNKLRRGMTVKFRTAVCAIFQIDSRNS